MKCRWCPKWKRSDIKLNTSELARKGVVVESVIMDEAVNADGYGVGSADSVGEVGGVSVNKEIVNSEIPHNQESS